MRNQKIEMDGDDIVECSAEHRSDERSINCKSMEKELE